MTPAEVFQKFAARAQDVRVIAPRVNGVEVDSNAMRMARSMGMPVDRAAERPVTAATAFDKLPPALAVKHFPELEGAYQRLAAAKRFTDKFPEPNREPAFNLIRSKISQDLHEGKTVTMESSKGRDR